MEKPVLYNLTEAQIKTLGNMSSSSTKIEQVGENIIIDTHFTDYHGSLSDGTSSRKNITFEIRPDGKRRMLYRDRTEAEHGDWVDPTEQDSRRN